MSTPISKEFNPSSAAAWKQKIQFELKGADYNKTLVTQTNEGISIKPFYHSDTFEKVEVPTSSESFKICQTITIESETVTNKHALEAIKNGINSIKFIAKTTFNFEELFKNLLQKQLDFHFQFDFFDKYFFLKLITFLKNENTYYNIDCIGNLAKTGNWFHSNKNDFDELKELIQKFPSENIVGIHADLYQNSGATCVQQIAYALAHANEYLTIYGNEVTDKIVVNLAIGSNYFFEISKLRAFRYLYSLLTEEYGKKSDSKLFCEPTLRNKTLYDYNVNMLRTTTESMSAIIGGSHTISNLRYDAVFHQPNEFAERIAKNQLLILKEESYFENAQQAATDTYYIESITKQLAEKSLNLFKEIEKSGGFLKQLKEGTIQRKIKESALQEQKQFDEGELVLLGTNKYPNQKERHKNELQFELFQKKNNNKTLIIPIIPKRLSESYELKRLQDET